MAHNNNTPEKVLNAPSKTYEFVEGTEFNGRNRAEVRKFASHEGYAKQSACHMKKTDHWLRVLKRDLAIKRSEAHAEYIASLMTNIK